MSLQLCSTDKVWRMLPDIPSNRDLCMSDMFSFSTKSCLIRQIHQNVPSFGQFLVLRANQGLNYGDDHNHIIPVLFRCFVFLACSWP